MADSKAAGAAGSFDVQEEIVRVRAEIEAAGDPGDNPDARQRLAKTLAAAGVDLPEGVSVDPIKDEDREAFVEAARKRAAAATARDSDGDPVEPPPDDKPTPSGATSTARTQPPQGRQTKPVRTT